MTYELDLNLLRKKLSRARLQREEPRYLIKEPEGELTESLSYLVENVLKPLFAGRKIHSADLDFNAFDQGDITDLLDYYMQSRSQAPLHSYRRHVCLIISLNLRAF